jgi:RNA polymerase sigma factor (TIGR02999 family)
MSRASASSASVLLTRLREGDRSALEQLFPLVYEQLHHAAQAQRRRLPRHDTLNTTALVHEAYLKLVGQEGVQFRDRAHFMAVAATAMRQILIDYARSKATAKRGGGEVAISFDAIERALDGEAEFTADKADALLALDRALGRLDQHSARQRQIVECRFFAGMSIEETAEALGISPATVKRDWSAAQERLYRELHGAAE